jgi:hypothetical protein
MKYLTKIRTLYLSAPLLYINIIGLNYISNSLTHLHLKNTPRDTNINNDGLKYLTNLTNLHISYNKLITDVGIKYLTNLTVLYLDCDLTQPKLTKDMFTTLVNFRMVCY